MILYDHAASGNCMKCRLALRELDIPCESVSVDLFKGETRTRRALRAQPRRAGAGARARLRRGHLRVRGVLLYLGEGTPLLPADPVDRARVHQWMFFEQNRIEADLSVARFLKLSGRWERMPEVFSNRLERGRDALETLERGLADGRAFVAGEDFTVADLALYGYVHCGADADPSADPRLHERISGWLDRVEARPGFVNDLAPLPAYASERPVSARRGEVALEHLAGGVARELVEEHDVARHLEAREVRLARGPGARRPRLSVPPARTRRTRAAAGRTPRRARRRTATSRDRRVVGEQVLDLAREDVLAAGDDHLVVAPVDEQPPVAVEVPDVAGAT